MRMRLPRNMAAVRILRATLMRLTRIIPMISLKRRLMRQIQRTGTAVRRPEPTGKTRRSVSQVSDRYSAIEMRWRRTERKIRVKAHLLRMRMKMRNSKSSLDSGIPASMRMMRQKSTGAGAMAEQDSMMTMILNMTMNTHMTTMMMS